MRKEALRTFLLSALIAFLLTFMLFTPWEQDKEARLFFKLIILLLMLTVLLSYVQSIKQAERIKRVELTYTVIRCSNCNYKLEREYREGDFVFKRVGICQCGGSLYIDMIYTIKPQRPSKPWLLR